MPRTLSKKRTRAGVERHSVAMVEVRKRLSKLPEDLAKHPEIGAVKITRRGKPVLAVMSWDMYESISETLEIMSDPAIHSGKVCETWKRETLIPGNSLSKNSVFDSHDCHHSICPTDAPTAECEKRIRDTIDTLASDPELRGKPLRGDLKGYRSVRAVGRDEAVS